MFIANIKLHSLKSTCGEKSARKTQKITKKKEIFSKNKMPLTLAIYLE
jgi:hypothetical protein